MIAKRTQGVLSATQNARHRHLACHEFWRYGGRGDPNEEEGSYKKALEMLYAVAFTIKMSKLGKHKLDGYFDYVVPPLGGLWWQDGIQGVDYARKQDFQWISLIRLPEFVTKRCSTGPLEATEKKQQDFSPGGVFSWEEGLCVQCMHVGPYDDEPATVAAMAEYANAQGYAADLETIDFTMRSI